MTISSGSVGFGRRLCTYSTFQAERDPCFRDAGPGTCHSCSKIFGYEASSLIETHSVAGEPAMTGQ